MKKVVQANDGRHSKQTPASRRQIFFIYLNLTKLWQGKRWTDKIILKLKCSLLINPFDNQHFCSSVCLPDLLCWSIFFRSPPFFCAVERWELQHDYTLRIPITLETFTLPTPDNEPAIVGRNRCRC